MSPLRCLVTLIVSLTALLPSWAANNLSINKIQTMDQLPERGIRRIYRDSEGYMWYGTTNGLCRDDGYNINIFHPGIGNNINHISEDSIGHLLVATDKGAWTIDKNTYAVSPLDQTRIGTGMVNSIFVTSDGNLWVNQYGKLRRYDRDGKWIKDYPVTDRKGGDTYVSGFCETRDGDILLTSYTRGVKRYDEASDSFVMYVPIEQDVPLGGIIQDHVNNYFWIYDFRGSLYRFNPRDERKFVGSLIRPHDSSPTHYENLLDFAQDDRRGYLWGITRNHLVVFRPEADGTLTPLDLTVSDSFSGALMSSILSTPGAMWIGCLDRESSTVYLDNNTVSSHSLPSVRRRYANPPAITAVLPAEREDLFWMLQFRSGPLLYDLATDRITYYDDNPALNYMRLRMAEQMAPSPSRGGVWVSRERSLTVYALTHRDMNIAPADSVDLGPVTDPTVKVTKIFEDRHGMLWLGTSEGLFCYDLIQRDFTNKFPDIGYVSDVIETNDRKIFGISKEIGPFEVTGGKVTKLSDDSTMFNKSSALAAAPDGKLWIGTDDGRAIEYNPRTHEFNDYPDSRADLGQSGIKQIYVDSDGHVRIMSDSRLIDFNPTNRTRFVYHAGKDVPLERFLSRTQCLTHDGQFVVGGIGGLAFLKPNPFLNENTSGAKAVVTDVTVSGASRLLSGLEGGLKLDTQIITLNPEDRNIEFHFSSLDYRYPSKLRYVYRIKGFDSEWRTTAPGENIAVYNTLGRGDHTLEVKVVDEYNRMSTHTTTLKIRRLPHFYETWWAWCIYIILLLGIGWYAMIYYQRRLTAKNEEMWSDSEEMLKMRSYLTSPVTLPEEEFQKLDRVLLKKATKVVEANLDDSDFDVNTLAAGVNMSRSTFSRKIKSITGKTPLDFIRGIKMQHACSLLESKNYTISQVAEMVGFSDRRYFTASFGKEIGVSPREYQNGMRKENKKGDEK